MSLSTLEKGAVLGLTNALAVAVLAAIAVAHGGPDVVDNYCGRLGCPIFVEHVARTFFVVTPLDAFLVVAMFGIPCGIAAGIACGWTSRGYAGAARYAACLPPLLVVVLLTTIVWSEIVPMLLVGTLVHLVIFRGWTELHVRSELARARISD